MSEWRVGIGVGIDSVIECAWLIIIVLSVTSCHNKLLSFRITLPWHYIITECYIVDDTDIVI